MVRLTNECTSTVNNPRGSIWRKWDLHLHTPSSHDYSDKSITNQEIIDAVKSKKIEVVAITDHHIIDTQRIKELKRIADKELTIFPGIEFCSDARGSQPIHFAGIFPEDCDFEYVWNEINSKTGIAKKKQGVKRITKFIVI